MQVMRDLAVPKSGAELYRFAGIAAFFRKYIPNHAAMTKPLKDALSDAVRQFCAEKRAKETIKKRVVNQDTRSNPEAFVALEPDVETVPVPLFEGYDDMKTHKTSSAFKNFMKKWKVNQTPAYLKLLRTCAERWCLHLCSRR